MLHAHPAHKVYIYHKSSLAIDYLERDNPLKSPVTWFLRVHNGLEGCLSLTKSVANKGLDHIWACNLALKKRRKLII